MRSVVPASLLLLAVPLLAWTPKGLAGPPDGPVEASPEAPARPEPRPSVYCNLGLGEGCGCADADRLGSDSDAFTPEQLGWLADRWAGLANPAGPPGSGDPTCLTLKAGKTYCRVDLDGAGASAALPPAFDLEQACAPGQRCIALRFAVGLRCPRDDGRVRVWADATGMSAWWTPGAGPPVPGAGPPVPGP